MKFHRDYVPIWTNGYNFGDPFNLQQMILLATWGGEG